jgi:hypothetical protein
MKKIKVFLMLFVICLAQTACYAPKKEIPSVMPTAIYAQVPSIVKRGENNFLVIDIAPKVICHAGIGYYNYNDEWKTADLPTIESLETGKCKWEWKVPGDAKDGFAEFRGYIEQDGHERNIFPTTFCIEVCK